MWHHGLPRQPWPLFADSYRWYLPCGTGCHVQSALDTAVPAEEMGPTREGVAVPFAIHGARVHPCRDYDSADWIWVCCVYTVRPWVSVGVLRTPPWKGSRSPETREHIERRSATCQSVCQYAATGVSKNGLPVGVRVLLSGPPYGVGWGGGYACKKKFVYLNWAAHFWISFKISFFPAGNYFWFGLVWVGGLAWVPGGVNSRSNIVAPNYHHRRRAYRHSWGSRAL